MSYAPDELALHGNISNLAKSAGDLALGYFRQGAATTAKIGFKNGDSPVTEADHLVDAYLRERLSGLAPDAGWLSEETLDNPDRLSRERVFIVDPIDGTRAFLTGDPRWCVSIALVERGRPTFGVLHLPALGKTFAAAKGRGATCDGAPISTNVRLPSDQKLIAGPAGVLKILSGAGLIFRAEPRIPSLAYRIARVADGSLDAGIASTDAYDWDIAAADILVQEAGGRLTDFENREPVYNRAEPQHGMLLAASGALRTDLLAVLRDSPDRASRSKN